jgi:hypothetical protein
MSKHDEIDDPRRRLLIQALAAGTLAATLPGRSAWAASIFGTPPAKLPPKQSIYLLDGSVKVNGTEATMSTIIKPNDTVETGAKSKAIFVVGGNSMILRENSQLKLEGKEEETSFLIQGLRLLSGKLLSVSRSSGTQIRTATATIGIRGTGYYIEADPEQTYFCTCYGLTDAASINDPGSTETIAAKHHDKPLYILNNAQPGKNIRKGGFINHTDQELMLIETLVGRTVPFVFAGDEYDAPRRGY